MGRLIANQNTQKRKYQKPNTLSIIHYHNSTIQIVWRSFEAFFLLFLFFHFYIFRITVRVSRNWICVWDACTNWFVWFCVHNDDTIVCNVVDCGSNMFFFLLLIFLEFGSQMHQSTLYSSSFHSLEREKKKNKLARVHIYYMGAPCFIFLLLWCGLWVFFSFLFDLSFVSFNSFRLPLVRMVLWPFRRVAL